MRYGLAEVYLFLMTHIALNDTTVLFASYPTICQHVDGALYGITFKSIS